MMPRMTSVLRTPRAVADPASPAPGGTPPRPASPAATRSTRSRWRDPRLVVGVALVALAVLLGARLLGHDGAVGVWSARVSLPAGQRVDAGDLVRREVVFGSQADADRYLSADTAPRPGTVLTRDVGAGELLPRAAVADAPRQSLTEVPLSVPADQVPATVSPGAVVDVWVTPARDGAARTTQTGTEAARLLFDDVVVVAAPHADTALGPATTRQVIVGVPVDQQASLPGALAALGTGTVLLTHRG